MIAVQERLEAGFTTDSLFNQDVVDIMATHLGKGIQVTLTDDEGTVQASVPLFFGEGWYFPGNVYSFVKSKWFAWEWKYLVELDEQFTKKNGGPLNIVGLTEGLKKDVGIGMVECKYLGDFLQSYDKKMCKKLRQAKRHSSELTYEIGTVNEAEPLLRKWFAYFDNGEIELVLALYRYWEECKVLKPMRITLDGKVVAYDILLLDEDTIHALLTPWDRENEILKKLYIGWFAIIQSCDYGKKNGYKQLSLGDTLSGYKRKFVTIVQESYYIGNGRRELNEQQ